MYGKFKAFLKETAIMAPHGKEMSKDLRKKVVLLHQKGLGYKKISNILSISRNTVAKVIQKYENDGETLTSAERSGRPRKLSLRCERRIMRKVKENPKLTAPELLKAIEDESGITVSSSTVRHIIHSNGLHGPRPRKKPFLKQRHKTIVCNLLNNILISLINSGCLCYGLMRQNITFLALMVLRRYGVNQAKSSRTSVSYQR